MKTEVKFMHGDYKITELGEIPINWKITKIGDVLKESKECNQPDLPLLSITRNFGVIPQDKTTKRDVSPLDKSKYKVLRPGQLVYNTMRMWQGVSAVSKLTGIISPAYTICNIEESKINSDFIAYLFKTPKMINQFHRFSQGLVDDTLSLKYDSFSKLKVILPSIKEQQKIAEILDTVVEQIENTDQLINKTKELKKGLMQQLLTKGIGHTKFKQTELGEIPFEWELKTLGQACIVVMGQSPKGESYNSDGIGIPLLNGPTEFGEKNPKAIQWTTSPTKYCDAKDILFCVRGSSIGRMNIADQRYCIGRGLAAIRQGKETTTKYMEFILEYKIEQVLKNTSGSTFPNITKDELNGVNLPIPPLNEQHRIAEILSTVDDRIASYEQEKEKYTELKKSLMQQLLTGKIRVTV